MSSSLAVKKTNGTDIQSPVTFHALQPGMIRNRRYTKLHVLDYIDYILIPPYTSWFYLLDHPYLSRLDSHSHSYFYFALPQISPSLKSTDSSASFLSLSLFLSLFLSVSLSSSLSIVLFLPFFPPLKFTPTHIPFPVDSTVDRTCFSLSLLGLFSHLLKFIPPPSPLWTNPFVSDVGQGDGF